MNKFRTDFLFIPHSYYNDTSLLLQHKYVYESDYATTCVSLNLLSGERYQNRVKLDFPNPFKDQFQILYSGSITGIFFLQSINSSEDIVLWNPTTNEFKVLPYSSIYSVRPYGHFMPIIFGYDPVNDDYKIIRKAHYPREIACYPVWEIYSLRRNLWRKIDIDCPYCFWDNNGLYMDGICHWLYHCFDNGEYYLVSFYLSNEVYIKTFIPLDIIFEDKDKYVVARRLLMLNGSVACFTGYEYHDKTTFHISILGEIGVKESWTKLFVIELGPKLFPTGVGMNGEKFFQNLDHELVYFNLCTQMKVELGCVERMSDSTEVINYKKNLHSFEN
ncbi:F-box/kelch-repeat protein At3g06240-like [Vicia villosa]|uniref:F-box/kelch-repeat protein At3g06240-like n=1 Tax=Vicia villosa TaxID=3911 RepID=UPI00273BE2E0|nr:F-box/kelch-repeat protein At3g06240-like [Vicia villosa]